MHKTAKFLKRLKKRLFTQHYSPLRRDVSESYLLLSALGLNPKTVIDIGVAKGTFELYRAFPDSHFLLVEPLKEFKTNLESILEKYKGEYILGAAGSKNGSVTINVHTNHLDGSSLYKEAMGSEADGEERTVQMVKIDDLLEEKSLAGPYLIKVDVQGAELDVLDGCVNALQQTKAIALEVSMFQFMKGSPQFYEVVSYMKERDFVAYDIVQAWNRPLDSALGQVDMVFVKDKGIFRKDHSFSTIEQMKKILG